MGDRCYTVPEVLALLKLPRGTFEQLVAARDGRGHRRFEFLEELQPRLGKTRRYKADPIDKYLRGEWVALPRLVVRKGRR